MVNIEALSNLTGLSVKFIRRCMVELAEFLEGHITRGDKNSILYSNNAVVIFERIKTYKDKGYNLPSIKMELANSGSSKGDDLVGESKRVKTAAGKKSAKPHSDDKETVSQLLNIITEKDGQLSKQQLVSENLRTEKEGLQKNIHELEQLKSTMENNIFLLTDGKTPEEALRERQKKQADRIRTAEILKELEYVDGHLFKGRHRKRLLEELRELQVQVA